MIISIIDDTYKCSCLFYKYISIYIYICLYVIYTYIKYFALVGVLQFFTTIEHDCNSYFFFQQ